MNQENGNAGRMVHSSLWSGAAGHFASHGRSRFVLDYETNSLHKGLSESCSAGSSVEFWGSSRACDPALLSSQPPELPGALQHASHLEATLDRNRKEIIKDY